MVDFMPQQIKNTLILGLGKVGSLVATLLQESGFSVTGIDATAHDLPFPTIATDVTNPKELEKHLKEADAVISCLPYHLNLPIAECAHAHNVHYFDLTEDVPTTNAIRKLASSAKSVMAPQCGLAPGFIGIVGADLAQQFARLRSINLRVGALPQHPTGLLGYAFNWSPEGVVNEYLNDCEVIDDGHIKMVPAMQALETIFISGIKLEAFTTSGGLGTMCETYKDTVETLNYKTMRYPGHCKLMRLFFHELRMREDREAAGRILVNAKPPVNDDVVYVHAAVEGWDEDDTLTRKEFVRAYYPQEIAGQQWRAISWTTAASITAVVEMVSAGTLPQHGFIKQEEIALDHFLETKNGHLYQA